MSTDSGSRPAGVEIELLNTESINIECSVGSYGCCCIGEIGKGSVNNVKPNKENLFLLVEMNFNLSYPIENKSRMKKS